MILQEQAMPCMRSWPRPWSRTLTIGQSRVLLWLQQLKKPTASNGALQSCLIGWMGMYQVAKYAYRFFALCLVQLVTAVHMLCHQEACVCHILHQRSTALSFVLAVSCKHYAVSSLQLCMRGFKAQQNAAQHSSALAKHKQ